MEGIKPLIKALDAKKKTPKKKATPKKEDKAEDASAAAK
jgi:hypothetical protein